MWRKYLSRRFLLAVLVIVVAVAKAFFPEQSMNLPWVIIWPAIGFIVGESGVDIVRAILKYKE